MIGRPDLPAEFRDLLDEYCSDTIDDERLGKLEAYLLADEAARREFVAYFQLHTELLFAVRARRAADSVLRLIEDRAPHRPAGARWGWEWRWRRAVAATAAVAAAAVLLVGFTLLLWPRGRREAPVAIRPYPKVDVNSGLAMILKLDGVQWEEAGEPHPAEGDLLAPGRFRFRSGRVTLSMLSGVMLNLEGPADLDLVSYDRIFCRQGKLRTRVPKGAEGLVISSPTSAVLDLGTEFALNVQDGGTSRVKVFEGRAEAMLHTGTGNQNLSQFLRQGNKAIEMDPKAGLIKVVDGSGGFIAPADLLSPSLVLDPAYRDAVLASRPWSYWRFESLEGGAIPNEIPDRPALLATGPIRLTDTGTAGDNQSARFKPGAGVQYLRLDGTWQPSLRPGYAVEIWFLSEKFDHTSLVAMPAEKDSKNHALILELTSQNRHTLHPPASVRFLDRWPPATGGGYNIYSKNPYIPYRWHHLVGQLNGGRMELYLDGEPTYSTRADLDHPMMPFQFLLGRLTTIPSNDWMHNRGFVGRLDEVALYDHPLSIEEIRHHRQLAAQRVRDLRPNEPDPNGGAPKSGRSK
jgi:hypothetical protein